MSDQIWSLPCYLITPVTLMLGPCFGGFFFKQKIEARIAADEDLKLADLLKYYLRESQAAKV